MGGYQARGISFGKRGMLGDSVGVWVIFEWQGDAKAQAFCVDRPPEMGVREPASVM